MPDGVDAGWAGWAGWDEYRMERMGVEVWMLDVLQLNPAII